MSYKVASESVSAHFTSGVCSGATTKIRDAILNFDMVS